MHGGWRERRGKCFWPWKGLHPHKGDITQTTLEHLKIITATHAKSFRAKDQLPMAV